MHPVMIEHNVMSRDETGVGAMNLCHISEGVLPSEFRGFCCSFQ